jgi:methylthioribulose-1-phosphate dehydratase
MEEEHIYILDLKTHKPIYDPNDFVKDQKFKISACLTLFNNAYKLRGAGAVIHSHSVNAMLATLIVGDDQTEFQCSHLEMIKGIRGHGYYDTLTIPIIENTAFEHELCDEMHDIMEKYPNTFAVLVRRHGVYIWGKDWIEAKTHSEVYDYLFGACVEMKKLGLDFNPKSKK